MKKIILMTALLGLGLVSRAQEPVITASSFEDNFRNTLWYNSYNGAGMAFDPLARYALLDLDASRTSGEWKRAAEPGERTEIDAHTSGATSVGEFKVMGDFSFRNIFDKATRFSTCTYELTDDMPYYVLDTMSSPWTRQEYEMSAMLVSPVLFDRLSAALEVSYATKVGAKQKDPRSEGYVMDIELEPSFAYKLSENDILGLAGLFDYTYQFSEPSNVNYAYDQKVFLVKGLGEAVQKKVGGNDGIPEVFSKTFRYGGSLQWSHTGEKSRTLTELYGRYSTVDNEYYVSLPRSIGMTKQILAGLDCQFLFGNNFSDKLCFDAFFRNTGGIEKIQQRDDTAFNQQWVTVGENRMLEMNRIEANVVYDHRLSAGGPGEYTWDLGGNLNFAMEDDSYLAPAASFNWMRVYASAFALRQLMIKESPLRIRLDAGYGMGLGGSYNPSPDSKEPPRRIYQEDIQYLSDKYINTSATVDYTLIRGNRGYRFAAKGGYAMPLGQDSVRMMLNLSFALLF